ncbi:MAG: VanZ family protein [Terriglobia bacterium]
MNSLTNARPNGVTRSQRALRWVVTFCWAGLIFYFSTKTFTASYTSVVLARLLAALHIHLSLAHFETLHYLVRKSAHFTEYAILSLLLFASISGAKEFEWNLRIAVLSVVIAGLYSLSDEFHQMFVPGRGPSIKDCGLDTTGAVSAMVLLFLIAGLAKKRARVAQASL